MVAEDARRGKIDLNGYIIIEDGSHNVLLTVAFSEAFDLRVPQASAS
jgi:hypothetical protein